MMKQNWVLGSCFLLTAMGMLFLCQSAFGQDSFAPVFQPSLTITKATGKIVIDGKLDDAGWQNAATIDKFVERYPGENIKPWLLMIKTGFTFPIYAMITHPTSAPP
jgi:hypothetical protein